VGEVRLAGTAELTPMDLFCQSPGAYYKVPACFVETGVAGSQRPQNVFEESLEPGRPSGRGS
jgi:hypothetical protein